MLIIMVLISILVPIISGAKDRARDTVCFSNLRQLYLATLAYKEDNDAWPLDGIADPQFLRYTGGHIFRCPESRYPREGKFDYGIRIEPNPMLQQQFVDPGLMLNSNVYQDTIACREKRGNEFPMIVDMNHVKMSPRQPDSRVLFVRVNGQIESKRFYYQDFKQSQTHLPCPYSLFELNL
jgi:hypothetical protein